MGRSKVLRMTSVASASALASLILLSACGSATVPDSTDGTAGASGRSDAGQSGESAEAGFGAVAGRNGPIGASGTGGFLNVAGFASGGVPTSGGSPSGGASASGGVSGGGSSCKEGVPCKCKERVGVTECVKDKSSCSCPPADQCESTPETPCFEPCGGEPFGAWVLEDACFSGRSSDGTCERSFGGQHKDRPLRIRLLDGGYSEIYGEEAWDFDIRVSPSCLSVSSVNECGKSPYLAEALLFSYTGTFPCTGNACGVCECKSSVNQIVSGQASWSRDGNVLSLGFGFSSANYCVQGDELWFGGTSGSGRPKVSYKFKKQSCTGVPLACGSRTKEQCKGTYCSPGLCKVVSGSPTHCAQADNQSNCNVLEGCSWDPNGCNGFAPEACEFSSCDEEPGCSWGPPQQKCRGEASACNNLDPSQCTSQGCSVTKCQPNDVDTVSCAQLTKTDCAKAPGCVVNNGTGAPCSGQTTCTAQTDTTVCGKLPCWAGTQCTGEVTPCSSLTPSTCHDVQGCIIEW